MKNLKIFSWIGFLFVLFVAGCQKDETPVEPVVPTEKPDVILNIVDGVSKAPIKVITLEWESFNATTCKLNGDTVALKDSKVFEIPEDIIFTFVVTGEGGTVEKKVEVKALVIEPEPLPTIVFFKADQYTLPEGGGGTWLSWEIHNAYIDSVLVNGIAQADTVGSYYTGFISNSGDSDLQITYTLTAVGPGGSKDAQLTLTVPAVPPPPPPLTITEYLVNFGSWNLIKIETSEIMEGPWETSFDANTAPICAQDETMTFSTNPNKVTVDFGLPCPGEEGFIQIWIYDWALNGTTTIQGVGDIIVINESEFIFVNIGTRIIGNTWYEIFVKYSYVHP